MQIHHNKNTLFSANGGMVDKNNNFAFLYETKDSSKDINYLSGWFLFGERSLFDKLIIKDYTGPFSEEFGLAYYEDTDLGFRATDIGIDFKIVNVPIVHFGKITSNQLNTKKMYLSARDIFIKKWNLKK